MSRRRKIVLIAVGAAALVGFYAWQRKEQNEQAIPGMVRRTEIRIAPEINGRLVRVLGDNGASFAAGDLLAEIDNPDLAAALSEALAALAGAEAERRRIYSGVRDEEVQIAAAAVSTAQANLLLTQQHMTRVGALATRGFNSRAQLDDAESALAKAEADLALKQALLAAARAGPTTEERRLADVKVVQAAATVADARARLAKTRLVAPVDGALGLRVAEIGEILTPGKPIVTFVPTMQPWIAFTIREDALHGLDIGSGVSFATDAGMRVDGVLTELRPLGEFATWRAARAVGDHDINAFRARFDISGEPSGLEPGMRLWLTRKP